MKDYTEGYDPNKPLKWGVSADSKLDDELIFEPKRSQMSGHTFYRGWQLEVKDYNINFIISLREEQLKTLDTILWYGTGGIVNNKVLQILKQFCPEDFQYFPVTIRNRSVNRKHPPFENHDYYLIHAIHEKEVLDINKSTFSLMDCNEPISKDNVMSISKAIFIPNSLGECHLAKDDTNPGIIVISQKLFKKFKENDVTGSDFYPDFMAISG